MKSLPEGISAYARTATFSARSIPGKLRKSHRTKAGTWAKIVILEGRLRYRILELDVRELELSPGCPGWWNRRCRTKSKPWRMCASTWSSTADHEGPDRNAGFRARDRITARRPPATRMTSLQPLTAPAVHPGKCRSAHASCLQTQDKRLTVPSSWVAGRSPGGTVKADWELAAHAYQPDDQRPDTRGRRP